MQQIQRKAENINRRTRQIFEIKYASSLTYQRHQSIRYAMLILFKSTSSLANLDIKKEDKVLTASHANWLSMKNVILMTSCI